MSHPPIALDLETSSCVDQLRTTLRTTVTSLGNPALASYTEFIITMDEIIQKNDTPSLRPIASAVQAFRDSIADFTPNQITRILNRTCGVTLSYSPPPADAVSSVFESTPVRATPIFKQDMAPKNLNVDLVNASCAAPKRNWQGQPSSSGLFTQSSAPKRPKAEVSFDWGTSTEQPSPPQFNWNLGNAAPAEEPKTHKQRLTELLLWIDAKIKKEIMPEICHKSFLETRGYLATPGVNMDALKGLAKRYNSAPIIPDGKTVKQHYFEQIGSGADSAYTAVFALCARLNTNGDGTVNGLNTLWSFIFTMIPSLHQLLQAR